MVNPAASKAVQLASKRARYVVESKSETHAHVIRCSVVTNIFDAPSNICLNSLQDGCEICECKDNALVHDVWDVRKGVPFQPTVY